MEKSREKYPWAPIRNLLGVLIGGVAFALLFALYMLYSYGSTGHYLLGNALLSPETITTLTFADPQSPGAKSARYRFDQIEFSRWDDNTKQWQRESITPAEYARLYAKISDEKSILEVSNEIVNAFYVSKPSRLTIFVKSEKDNTPSDASSKALQVVEFAANGDYYRVELRGPEGSNGWAYFYHKAIGQEITTNQGRQ